MATSGSFNTSGYSGGGYPDHYVFSWSLVSQNIEDNTSKISWSLYGAGGSDSYRYTCVKQKYVTVNGQKQSNSTIQETKNNTVAFSGTSTIKHNADGTGSFSASAGGAFYYYGSYNSQGSGSWSLPTIPRQATIQSAPDFNDEENPTITYTNPAGNSVTTLQACISLDGSISDIPYRDISKTGNSYTFELTTEERNTLRNACTDSNTLSLYFYVKTVIGGNTYYSKILKRMTIINASPIFTQSNVTYKDNNSTTVAVTRNNQKLVQGLSELLVTVTSATALKGASIIKYDATINGETITKYSSGNIDFGVINSGSNLDLTVKVTDSRGNSTTVSKEVIFLPWVNPTAIISLKRKNNYEDETYLKVTSTYSSIDSKNTITVKYQCKKTSEQTYSSLVTINDDEETTIIFDKDYAWNIRIVLTDKFGTTTYNTILAKGKFIFFVDTKKLSVGINCFPVNNESLEVNGVPVTSSSGKVMKQQNLDLTNLDDDYFYPITWFSQDTLNIEINSPTFNGSEPHNQNRLKASISYRGWSDQPKILDVLQFGMYDPNEVTIHSIYCGEEDGYNAIYLRGGYTYSCYCDVDLTLCTQETAYGNERFSLLDSSGNPVTSFSRVVRNWIYTDGAKINANSKRAESCETADKTQGTLTIQKNGSNVETFNGSANKTANITVPTGVKMTTTSIISGYSTSAKTGSVSGAVGIYVKATPRIRIKRISNIYSIKYTNIIGCWISGG